MDLTQLGQPPARGLARDRELERVAAHRAEHDQRQGARQRVERLAGTGEDEADRTFAEQAAPGVVAGTEVERGAHAARQAALGQRDAIGCLAPGAWADMIAFPVSTAGNIYENIVAFADDVPWMLVNGEAIGTKETAI